MTAHSALFADQMLAAAPRPVPRFRSGSVHSAAVLAGALLLAGCTGSPATNGAGSSDAERQYPLSTLPTAEVTINGQTLRVWIARDDDPNRPHVTEEGLMHVRPSEIADDQGMLFIFRDERVRGFWMRNTITPLDIAYARWNGTIVQTWQMPPLTDRTFSSIEPAMFALELKQGTLARLGVKVGDRLEIPAELVSNPP